MVRRVIVFLSSFFFFFLDLVFSSKRCFSFCVCFCSQILCTAEPLSPEIAAPVTYWRVISPRETVRCESLAEAGLFWLHLERRRKPEKVGQAHQYHHPCWRRKARTVGKPKSTKAFPRSWSALERTLIRTLDSDLKHVDEGASVATENGKKEVDKSPPPPPQGQNEQTIAEVDQLGPPGLANGDRQWRQSHVQATTFWCVPGGASVGGYPFGRRCVRM